MLSSNGKKNQPQTTQIKQNKKLYRDERREGEDLKLNTQKPLKETMENCQQLFLADCFFKLCSMFAKKKGRY